MTNSTNSFKNKVIRKLKSGTWYPFYNTFYEKVPIDRREILLASRSGISLESNILAILTELSRPEYRRFKKVLAVQKNSREQIEKKLAHYHISVDKIVHMSTPDYYYHLAKAGYLINDTTFPGRYIKKKGQIYLNVWHGTPLKRMGQDNEEERYDMGNIMRNLLMSDYLVFPNLYMEEKMSGAFNLTELYQGTVLHEGYPRNSVFFDQEHGKLLKETLGYQDCQLSVYMPTFRESENLFFQTMDLKKFSDYLKKNNYYFFTKLHPKSKLKEKFSEIHYDNIQNIGADVDPYTFLKECDLLVTDYSSIYSDYLMLNRPSVLFPYDFEEYSKDTRECYFPYEEYMPEVRAYTMDELMEQITIVMQNDTCAEGRKKLKDRIFAYTDGESAKRLCKKIRDELL